MATTPLPTGPTEDDGAADALAQPSLGPQIAQNFITAGIQNNGSPRDWAENAVSAVTSALAGFGAAGKVPPGAGALYGVGAAARQGQQRQDEQRKQQMEEQDVKVKQQQGQEALNLEKQRQSTEESQWGKDYQLRLGENARQQAGQIKEFALDDARLRQLTDEHNQANFDTLKDHADFIEKQLEYSEHAYQNGAKPMQGSPTFTDLGQAEQWANQADIAKNTHVDGYRHRPLLNPDMSINIVLTPDDGVKDRELTDASGKKFTTPIDFEGSVNAQEHFANIRKANADTSEAQARADELEAEASKFRNLSKADDTLKGARQAYDKTVDLAHPTGDFNSLPPGQKEVLAENARKQYQLSYAAWQRAKNDFAKMVRQAGTDGGLPTDKTTGEVDTNSDEYKDAKDSLDTITEALGEAQDDMNRFTTLGHQVKVTGGGDDKTGGGGNANQAATGQPDEITTARGRLPVPKPPAPGAPITREAFQPYLKANGGDVEKAKQAALAAGWGPPQNPQ